MKKAGASKSYAKSGTTARTLDGGTVTIGAGGANVYEITYQIEGQKPRKITLTLESYNQLEEEAKQYQKESSYAWFSGLTRNVHDEYVVMRLEALQGRKYEMRSPLQRILESTLYQSASSVILSVAYGPAGSYLAGAATGTHASAGISEKEAKGEEVTKGDYVEAGADVLVARYGSEYAKAAVEYQTGKEVVETVTYDIAAEVATEATYQSGKSVVMQEEGSNG